MWRGLLTLQSAQGFLGDAAGAVDSHTKREGRKEGGRRQRDGKGKRDLERLEGKREGEREREREREEERERKDGSSAVLSAV